MYKKIGNDIITGLAKEDAIIRIEDNAFIPFDPANTDYQAYLKWLDAGNVPLPAEEGVQQEQNN